MGQPTYIFWQHASSHVCMAPSPSEESDFLIVQLMEFCLIPSGISVHWSSYDTARTFIVSC